jgi:uncharacterized protein (DUF2141 family)
MKIILFFVCTLVSVELFAQHTLQVVVSNVEEIKGNMMVAVYNNEGDFMKKHVDVKKAKITGKEVIVIFENMEPGDYAITLFQDKNENLKLDTNVIGMPKEPYGFSNNVMGNMGPPSFEQAKVKLDANKKLSINLR